MMLNILTYHGIVRGAAPLADRCFLPAGTFEAQMAWLASCGVRVMHLDDAAALLSQQRLQKPVCCITFDDGFRSSVTIARPILQRLGLPATIFVTTGHLGTRTTPWPNRILHALERTTETSFTWERQTFAVRTLKDRCAVARSLQAMVKERHPGQPDEAARAIASRLGVPVDEEIALSSPFAMMSHEEARDALADDLIRLGAHTVSHPMLSALDDRAVAAEIDGSLDAVAALTGRPCRLFAYPNGRDQDFDDRAVQHLQRRGVRWAVTTARGSVSIGFDPLRMARWSVGPGLFTRRFRLATVAMAKAPSLVGLAARARLRLM